MTSTPAIVPQTGITPAQMVARALEQGGSVEVLEKLLALQERWEASQAKKDFERAMADMRQELPTIIKDRRVDFTTSHGRTHYQYEDLASVTEQLSPVMAEHGLSFRWRTESGPQDMLKVTCIVSHAGGHSEETSLSAKSDSSGNKNHIQAIGSAVTYLQRYTLKAALGVAAARDDDAQSVPQSVQGQSSTGHAPEPSAQPTALPEIIAFGKHNGKRFDDPSVPDDYIQWMSENAKNPGVKASSTIELQRRLMVPSDQAADTFYTHMDKVDLAQSVSEMTATIKAIMADKTLNAEDRETLTNKANLRLAEWEKR